MHVSRLLAWALLLTLLSLRPEAKPAAPQKPPRNPPGEELAGLLAAAGGDKKGDKAAGGGGGGASANKGSNARLLRDLRVDTRSRAAWARLLHDYPNARKYRGVNKKGLSKGCFGLKLDRIGSMSGLGC
ncbi:C-type natriuretic peptide [Monodelphis domestica]|uniref:C-type natriuretic peptide n=1 Tax=Monodelphis domestica TaxID=13616 RepID=F7B965_MONDO|nr:C-type natriuretic peptide [Monodelphis domestica]